jgi:hypothetical protein
MKLLVKTWLSSTYLWSFVDVHVVIPPSSPSSSSGNEAREEMFPINYLRNVAHRYARTSLVLSLDVDIVPGSVLHDALRSLRDVLIAAEKTVFLVPVFQVHPHLFYYYLAFLLLSSFSPLLYLQALPHFNLTDVPRGKKDVVRLATTLDHPSLEPIGADVINHERWYTDDTFHEVSVPPDGKTALFYVISKDSPL